MKKLFKASGYTVVILLSVILFIAMYNRDVKYSDYKVFTGDTIRVINIGDYSLKPQTDTFTLKSNVDVMLFGAFISGMEFDIFHDTLEDAGVVEQMDITVINNELDEITYISNDDTIVFIKKLTDKTTVMCSSFKDLATATIAYEELVFYVVPEANTEQVITYGEN